MSTTRRGGLLAAATLLIISGFVVLVAGPARAGTVTFTDDLPLQPTNWNQTLTIPQFDPAQGTLLSVEVAFDATVEGQVQYESQDPAPATITLELKANVELQRPDTTTVSLLTPLVTQTDSADAFDGTIDFDGPSGGTFPGLTNTLSDTQTFTGPADLALFTGTGTLDFPVDAQGMSTGSGAGNLLLLFMTNAAAELTVTYTFAAPAIDIEKATNGDDADTPTGPTIPVGDPVNWSYDVTNTGDVDLTNVVVVDDQGVAVSCPQDTLAVGESMTCAATGTAQPGQYANLGTVSADSAVGPVGDQDPSHYFGAAPAIDIEKTPDSQTVVSGSDVTFTIVVTNTGNVDLSNVTVADPLAPNCDATIGGLAVGASTAYDCTVAAVTAGFTNVATVTGEGPGGEQVTDEDDAVVEVTPAPAPAIDIEKTPDSQTVVSGSDVTFTIAVTNTGNVDLTNVVVTDPLAPDCDATIGDLAVGASTSYDCTVTNVTAGFTNVATVTGEGPGGEPVTDEDDAVVEVRAAAAPGIEVQKTPDTQSVEPGSTVTFTITVTNIGNVALTNVAVVDPAAPDCDATIGDLAVGASTSYDCTVTNVTSAFTNVATVTGEGPGGEEVTDDDDARVEIASISVLKVANPTTASVGNQVTYTYTVTNTGTVTLTNVSLTDDKLGAISLAKTTLAPGESTTGTATATVVATDLPGPLMNVATVTGEEPGGKQVTDQDDATVALVAALPVTTPPQTLPATGFDADHAAGMGLIFIAVGVLMLAASIYGGSGRLLRVQAGPGVRLRVNLLPSSAAERAAVRRHR